MKPLVCDGIGNTKAVSHGQGRVKRFDFQERHISGTIVHHQTRKCMAIDPDYLAAFQADLATLTTEEMFAKYVEPEACHGLPGIDQLALRQRVAERFELGLASVMIVGSAKIGFTLTHKDAKTATEEDRPPFSSFSDQSDVDVAIISDVLFDEVWKRSFEFWHSSGYSKAQTYWPRGRDFREYVFRGWMRPDMLPNEASIPIKDEWFEFFRQVTNAGYAGDYPVKAGLYRERYFLERYQSQSLAKAKQERILS